MSSFIIIRDVDKNFISSTSKMRVANSIIEMESEDFNHAADIFLKIRYECELHYIDRKRFDDSIMLAKKLNDKNYTVRISDNTIKMSNYILNN
jgi:hypothetical protein